MYLLVFTVNSHLFSTEPKKKNAVQNENNKVSAFKLVNVSTLHDNKKKKQEKKIQINREPQQKTAQPNLCRPNTFQHYANKTICPTSTDVLCPAFDFPARVFNTPALT